MKNRFLVIVKDKKSHEEVGTFKTYKQACNKVQELMKRKESILSADLNENYKNHFVNLSCEVIDLGA